MRTLALWEFRHHAFRLIVGVRPKAELADQDDDSCWNLVVPDGRFVEDDPLSVNNARWLVGRLGDSNPTLELARLFHTKHRRHSPIQLIWHRLLVSVLCITEKPKRRC